MSIINPFMVKTGAGVTSLTLEADSGKSLLVKDILVKSVADVFLSIKIDKTLVGYFSVDDDKIGNPLGYTLQSGIPAKPTILEYLWNKGIFKGYPVEEGQKLTLSGLGASAMYATIVYQEFDAGDITREHQNGTEADEYVIINYGDAGGNVNTAGDQAISNQVSPKDFPEFPFGNVVPARKEISLHSILASERAADDGSDKTHYIHTTYYKLKQERETLFDEDVNGIYAQAANVATNGAFECENGQSLLGEGTDKYRRGVLLFDPPLVFSEGEELNVYMTTEVAATAGTFLQEETRIGAVMTVNRVA